MPVENTYTIIAIDGNQYGPITLAQLQAWIQEVRVAPDTQILRSDLNQWHPAAHYKELNLNATLAAGCHSFKSLRRICVSGATRTSWIHVINCARVMGP